MKILRESDSISSNHHDIRKYNIYLCLQNALCLIPLNAGYCTLEFLSISEMVSYHTLKICSTTRTLIIYNFLSKPHIGIPIVSVYILIFYLFSYKASV